MPDTPKTIKMFTAGGFNRSESGKTIQVTGHQGLLEVSVASRKDIRDTIRAATATNWASTDPYLRGQILYRVAEMLSSRSQELQNHTTAPIQDTIDTLVSLAGWSDKTGLVFGATPNIPGHTVTTTPTPLGLYGAWLPKSDPLELVRLFGPPLAAGNPSIILGDANAAELFATIGEILVASDVPPGVVQLAAATSEAVHTLAGATDVRVLNVTHHPDFQELEALAAQSLTICEHRATDTPPHWDLHAIRAQLGYQTTWTPTAR